MTVTGKCTGCGGSGDVLLVFLYFDEGRILGRDERSMWCHNCAKGDDGRYIILELFTGVLQWYPIGVTYG